MRKGSAGMEEVEKTRVNFRIEKQLKDDMEETCRKMGMNMTTAFCLFCRNVTQEGKLPFELGEKKRRGRYGTKQRYH